MFWQSKFEVMVVDKFGSDRVIRETMLKAKNHEVAKRKAIKKFNVESSEVIVSALKID